MFHTNRGRALRVLVIEDDIETGRYLVKGLSESGYTVDHAEDGPQGVLLATGKQYDVLIVDRMLPGLDGLSIIESLVEQLRMVAEHRFGMPQIKRAAGAQQIDEAPD